MRGRPRPRPEEYSAEIHDLAQDGRGVARVGGKVTFIGGALPGERVRYRLHRQTPQADEGQLSAVERASADRVEPRCAHFGVCGGCSLQHLSGAGQRAFKQKQLLDALERIGKLRPEHIAPPVTGPEWSYRRRARLSVKHVAKKGGVLVGFREMDSPYVAQLESCQTLDRRVGLKLKAIAECIGRLDPGTLVPQIEVAAGEAVALVFRVMREPTAHDHEILREFGQREGFEIYLQTAGLDSVRPLNASAGPLSFSPDGSSLAVYYQPTDFIQINDAVNQKMVRQALDWLAIEPGDAVLELFSGLGNFSLPLARAGARVTAVEGEAGLAQRARENAVRNGLDIRCERTDLFQPDSKADWLTASYDAVLLDPPRAGAREILPLLAERRPPKILYVSCHPGTLARDAAFLVHERGYRLQRAGILDMFPHTTHVESMALFERS